MDEKDFFAVPDLPDEGEYSPELRDGYELLECFSDREDMSTFLARNLDTGKLCVVKCYLKENVLYGHSEPEPLRRLDAAPLPRFLAEYRNDRMRCVLREYIPGESLDTLAEKKRFSEEEVLKIGVQLCRQLDVLHSMDPPVIHRDIKPQNVVLREDGTAVLIDFGIARVHTEKETDTVAFGTQGFAPPEQYGFAQTDARSDIYSLGILLCWLLHRQIKPERENRSPLEKVIARCTAFDPEKRFADVRQVERALLAAEPQARRKRSYLTSAAAVFLLVLAVIGIGAFARGREKTVVFSQSLIEQAVRLNLGLGERDKITANLLDQVTGIYIVADTAYPDADGFYPAIGRWYAQGQSVRGEITNLEDLRKMPNLEQVCIVAQELSDISALQAMSKLNKVEFKHNYITDIGVLAGMGHLTSVGINDNPVRDISPLTECPKLAFLDLCDVRSYDPTVVQRLGNFDLLDISNPTDSYRYLDGKSILDLRIAWTGLDDLHVLDRVTRLERLYIDHSQVSDLSPLKRHTGLKTLNLAGLPVADLSVLLELKQLEEVTISADMQPLADALGDVPFAVRVE